MRSLYRAQRVHTFGHPPTGDWVLVDGRHVERVGAGEPPKADRIVDLPGATIVPGFVDAHVHLTSLGLAADNEDVVTDTWPFASGCVADFKIVAAPPQLAFPPSAMTTVPTVTGVVVPS